MRRVVIKSVLDEIATEVGDALRNARLDFPVYLTVPNSSDTLATIVCPHDPTDEDWLQASEIVCRIIGKRFGNVRLRTRELVCAVANETIAATEVAGEPLQSAEAATSAFAARRRRALSEG